MNNTPLERRLLDLREASEFLSLSTQTLRALIANGKLAVIRANERGKILISSTELESFIERNRRPSPGEVKA